MAFDYTPGGANATSYASTDEYDDYWDTRVYNTAAKASTVTDDTKEAALQWATRLLDAIFRWRGAATDDVQQLAWPRSGLLTRNGFALADDVIPRELKDATCEFAGVLITGGSDRTLDDPDNKMIGSEVALTSIKAGPVALTYADRTFASVEAFDAFIRSLGSNMAYLSKAMPDSVRTLIPPAWYKEATLRRPIKFGAY